MPWRRASLAAGRLADCVVAGWRALRVCAVVSIGFTLCACEGLTRTPLRYLIPAGYVGWIQIDYDVATGAAVEREGKYIVLRIPANGHLVTATHFEAGAAADEYYYYDARGERRRFLANFVRADRLVWGEHVGQSGGGPQFEREFIGAEKQYLLTTGDPLFWPPKVKGLPWPPRQ